MHLRNVPILFGGVLSAAVVLHARVPVSYVISVDTVDELYDAVNTPGHTGAQIVLEGGLYALTDVDANLQPRPNGGRLELQENMSLSGRHGHSEAVVIDAAALPTASYANAGAVRVGRGSNTIEWLTVRNAVNGQSGIDSGLFSTSVANVRLAHLIVQGNKRGLDLRNNANATGRVLFLDLDDNDLFFNQSDAAQGLRIVNNVSPGSTIRVTMKGNRLHDNGTGMLVANLNSSDAVITIDSHNDEFDGNIIGCNFLTGISTMPGVHADRNVITFDAHAGSIQDNIGTNPQGDSGGLDAFGGVAMQPDLASNNSLSVAVWGMKISGNQGADIHAWGARAPVAPAGTGNHVEIELNGVSKKATSTSVASEPVEPAHTNTVTIIR